jgi:hypothetical protein
MSFRHRVFQNVIQPQGIPKCYSATGYSKMLFSHRVFQNVIQPQDIPKCYSATGYSKIFLTTFAFPSNGLIFLCP